MKQNTATLVLSIILAARPVHAIGCEDGYHPRDRHVVREVFAHAAHAIQTAGSRALLVASESLSLNQVLSLDIEYQALLQGVTASGDTPRDGIHPRTAKFLSSVVDTNYLGLAGTAVVNPGLVDHEATHEYAVAANEASLMALRTLVGCL